MSLIYHTSEKADVKRRDYSLIVCMALAVVVASAVFTPAAIGSGITNQVTFVGP